MAKNDLIGGSLWEHYSNKVSDRMNDPKNRGELTEAEAEKAGAKLVVADYGAEACGDAVRLFWLVKDGLIIAAKFKSFGCGTAIAASDMMTEMCIGKTVDEVVKITNIDVENALRDSPDTPAVPPQKMHCSVMAYDAIKTAAALYYGKDVGAYDDDDIVCECGQVKMSTIVDAIRLNNLTTIEQITQYTKAGAFCKSCIHPGGHETKKYYLVDILAETRAKMEQETKLNRPLNPSDLPFDQLSLFQKSKKIEEFMAETIAPFLANDGGSATIADISEFSGRLIVAITYHGACHGCASAGQGTRMGIEDALRSQFDDNIDVVVY